jgi:hypothetical protein
VGGVAATTREPLSGEAAGDFVWAAHGPSLAFARPASARDRISAAHAVVTPNYVHVLGIPLVRGRLFTAQDVASEQSLTNPDAPRERRVAIVNETLASRLWPGETAVGKRLVNESYQQVMEVVGVVADVRDTSVSRPPDPQLYEPLLQNPPVAITLLVDMRGDEQAVVPALAARLRSTNRNLVVGTPATLESRIAGSIAGPRFTLVVVGRLLLPRLVRRRGVHPRHASWNNLGAWRSDFGRLLRHAWHIRVPRTDLCARRRDAGPRAGRRAVARVLAGAVRRQNRRPG